MDNTDAGVTRLLHITKADFLSIKADRAAVRLKNAAADTNQGGFTGAVFTHQGVNFTARDGKAYITERLYAAKVFADVVELNNRSLRGIHNNLGWARRKALAASRLAE